MATIDHVMEHIAAVCKKDPISVRIINLAEKDSQIIKNIIQEVIKNSEYYKRLDNINQHNRVSMITITVLLKISNNYLKLDLLTSIVDNILHKTMPLNYGYKFANCVIY